MTPLIHQTVITADFRRSRQHITDMKMAYIRRRHRMFRRIFVKEFKKRLRIMIASPWNRYTRKRYHVWSDDTLLIGKKIHEHFGYSEKTNVDDMLMSWRRLYLRMYPQEKDR